MASLYQSSSWRASRSAAIWGAMFTAASRQAPEQEGRILRRIDAQAHAAPFDRMPLAGHEVLDRADAVPRIVRTDLKIAEMEPELARTVAGERNRGRHRVVARDRLLDEADHLLVVHLGKAEIARLQERRIVFADPVEAADVVLDVAGLVPVAHLELVFLRVEIFLLAGNRLPPRQRGGGVDAAIGGKGRRPADAP